MKIYYVLKKTNLLTVVVCPCTFGVTYAKNTWAYPTAEDTDNRENYRAVLKAQFGAEVDGRDKIMWLLNKGWFIWLRATFGWLFSLNLCKPKNALHHTTT